MGLRLVAGPMLLAHRVTGYVPKAFRYPFEGDVPKQYEASARVAFFDAAVDRYLDDIAQFVILGAGFDTRAFRLPKDARVRPFEIDAPKTQALKREMLEKAGIDQGQRRRFRLLHNRAARVAGSLLALRESGDQSRWRAAKVRDR